MNIYELQKEYNILLAQIQLCTRMACELRTTAESPKIPQLDRISVQGHGKKRDMTDTVIPIIDWEDRGKELEKKLAFYRDTIAEMEKILKEFGDIEQLMYLEYYLKGYSALKIGMRYGIDKSTVYKKIKKIEMKEGEIINEQFKKAIC